jgi:hypothetical protein
MFSVRVILWTVAMAYAGFILTNQGLRTFNSLSITEAILGALTGFFLAIMFTLRLESAPQNFTFSCVPASCACVETIQFASRRRGIHVTGSWCCPAVEDGT